MTRSPPATSSATRLQAPYRPELLAKFTNERHPAKQAELRGQINEVRRQIAYLEPQAARAKAAEEDRLHRENVESCSSIGHRLS